MLNNLEGFALNHILFIHDSIMFKSFNFIANYFIFCKNFQICYICSLNFSYFYLKFLLFFSKYSKLLPKLLEIFLIFLKVSKILFWALL